jgi:hypothetical protein
VEGLAAGARLRPAGSPPPASRVLVPRGRGNRHFGASSTSSPPGEPANEECMSAAGSLAVRASLRRQGEGKEALVIEQDPRTSHNSEVLQRWIDLLNSADFDRMGEVYRRGLR